MVKKMFRFFPFLTLWICVYNVYSYRLSNSVIPTHYKLEILTYLGEPNNFNFNGKVWIEITCLQPTYNITLHSKDLNITDSKVSVRHIVHQEPEEIEVKDIQLDENNDFLIVNLDEQLEKDHKYELFIPFQGELTDSLKGFYRSSYKDEKTKEKKWLGVTQFEAISARRAFPCFDEPAMKATFEIILGRKDGYSSISNMPLLHSEPIKEKDGWFWDKFEPSVPMSTYLVAFVVSDFGFKLSEPSKHNNVTFKIWARKDALNQVDFARDVGPKALEYFEDFFGIDYPLPKQDMIALPDFSAGAMENWGLITYREQYLLFDPKVSSTTSRHYVTSVIAHELAHQWFGNLVTMKWWTDLWLNEGFATYMAGRAVDHLFPQWNSLEEEAVNNALNVFSFDSLKTSHPVSVPIGHPNEIDEIFDTISYKKGSFLIRMMSLFLGEETLRHGVSNYLKKHTYGNAEQDDLWESLTIEAHKNGILPKDLSVKTVMDTWTVHTGYPVITVQRNYETNTAEITQRRFIKDQIKSKSDDSCWWVPLSYTDAKSLAFNSTKPKSWLSCPKETEIIENLPDKDTWVIFNIRIAGLYKINYDQQNWKLLSQTLNSPNHKNIPTLNKVQLIDDAFDLAWTADLKYDVLFDLLKYLKNEDLYLPWKATLSNVNALSRQLKKSSIYGNFKIYMRHLIAPIYEKIGGFSLSESDPEKLDSIKHKVMIINWACRFEVANCVSDAKALFKKYQSNPNEKNIIPNELRTVIYCTAIKHGGEKEWEFIWSQYKKSNVASEKSSILNSLGCTRELWLLNRYLDWSINEDSGIRRQDSGVVFDTVASNDIGYYVAKNFLYTRIKNIYKHLSQNSRRLSRCLSSITNQMTSEEDYNELQKFVKDNHVYLKEVKKGVEQSLETAKLNVQWQKRHLEEIEQLLDKFVAKEKREV